MGELKLALVVFYVFCILIEKWLPCLTEPNIWQMTFHFSLGLNLTVLKFKQNKFDLVGSKVSEYLS
jgi:cytochrome b561